MHYLYTVARQVPELQRVIEAEHLDDVSIRPAFLGRVVVWCGSEASRDRLLSRVQTLVAA